MRPEYGYRPGMDPMPLPKAVLSTMPRCPHRGFAAFSSVPAGDPPDGTLRLSAVSHDACLRGRAAVFENAYRLLTIMPESISPKPSTTYKCLDVGRQISAANSHFNAVPRLSPVYFLDTMPGQYLKLPADTCVNDPAVDDLAVQLKQWYLRFAAPRWLTDSVDAVSARKLSN